MDCAKWFGWPPDSAWNITGDDLLMWVDRAVQQAEAARPKKPGG